MPKDGWPSVAPSLATTVSLSKDISAFVATVFGNNGSSTGDGTLGAFSTVLLNVLSTLLLNSDGLLLLEVRNVVGALNADAGEGTNAVGLLMCDANIEDLNGGGGAALKKKSLAFAVS